MQRITIFMSPFNVHVNRAPASGKVLGVTHIPGKFLKAFAPEASSQNERCAVHMKTTAGDEIVFVQISGWFARRIVTYPQVGDHLHMGDIFGMIKFGSRMDVYFSDEFVPAVQMNQKVAAGSTILVKRKA